MKKALLTLVFLCSILVASFLSGAGNTTDENQINEKSQEAELENDLDKLLSKNESLDVYHLFVESGLTNHNMVAEISSAETYEESEEFNIVSMINAKIDKSPVMKIIEFQSKEEAKRYYNSNKANGFIHENIYVSMTVNVNQIEKYKKVVVAKKAIK